MKIFVATRFGHRLRFDFREFVDDLYDHGHIVVSSWHEEPEDCEPDEAAWDCIHDLEEADVVVLWSVDADGGGGMQWEAGYAFAKGKPVIVYGERNTIYDYAVHFTDEIASVVELIEDAHDVC